MTFPAPRAHLSEEARAAAGRFHGYITTPASERELIAFADTVRWQAPGLAAAALRVVTSSPPPGPDHADLVARAEDLEREAATQPKLFGIVPQPDPVILEGLLLQHDRYIARVTRRPAIAGAVLASAQNTTEGRLEAIEEAHAALRAYLAGQEPRKSWEAPLRLRLRRPNTPGAKEEVVELLDTKDEVLLVRTWREVLHAGPYPVAGLLVLLADGLSRHVEADPVSGSAASLIETSRGALALLEMGTLPSNYGAARGVLSTERREQEEAAIWALRDRGFNC